MLLFSVTPISFYILYLLSIIQVQLKRVYVHLSTLPNLSSLHLSSSLPQTLSYQGLLPSDSSPQHCWRNLYKQYEYATPLLKNLWLFPIESRLSSLPIFDLVHVFSHKASSLSILKSHFILQKHQLLILLFINHDFSSVIIFLSLLFFSR